MPELMKDGPEGVVNYTENRAINIFKKKFVFIPINDDEHWSLCVVVNPNLIASVFNTNMDESGDDEEMPW